MLALLLSKVEVDPRSPLLKDLGQLQQGTIFMTQVLPTNVYIFSLTT